MWDCWFTQCRKINFVQRFNSIKKAEAANFPFCTIDPNIGNVSVPDERLNIISNISKSKKTINAMISFVDIAGLVKELQKEKV